MSLNNFQLSPFLVQELYKDSLVTIDNQQLIRRSENPDLVYLGKNGKNILFLVHEENAAFLEDSDLNFLVDILKACNLSLADTALVNCNKNPGVCYKTLAEQFHPSIIFFFGIEPATLEFPLQFPHYQVQSYNKQTYLSAPALKKLATDKEEKKKLWASLQRLFSL